MREKPLALYVFSRDNSVTDTMIDRVSSGGLCVNDTIFQGAINTLPFGGVGNSGMGAYHGKLSFDTFSHRRGCMIRAQNMEAVNRLRYPPYTEELSKWLGRIMAHWLKPKGPLVDFLYYTLCALALAFVVRICFNSVEWVDDNIISLERFGIGD